MPVPLTGQSSRTWPAFRIAASAAALSSSLNVEASITTRRGTLALAMVATVAASARGFGQAENDGRRLPGHFTGIGGDFHANAGERAPPRRSDIVTDDTPARGVEIFRKGAAHDAETDNTDGAFFLLVMLFLKLRVAHMPFIFIATDHSGLASRLATMSLVTALYFLKWSVAKCASSAAALS